MSMSYHHQLQLLVDILRNQQTEHYGTHNEYEQIQLLVQDLIQNPSVPEETKSALRNLDNFVIQHDREGEKSNFSFDEMESYVNEFEKHTTFLM
ncbi:MAG: YtzH-like family protein [Bacillus sp. (in: Bacteria)]|nr:YtzH-like family protein [Bacillus sp. (in: firmicutes)]